MIRAIGRMKSKAAIKRGGRKISLTAVRTLYAYRRMRMRSDPFPWRTA